jgi:molybdenum cofactor cytidylyltransferase
MASSIRAGLAVLRQFSRSLDGTLIALCDQPAFSAGTITRLREMQQATGAGIVAARYAGRAGAPAWFHRDHFPTLAALTGEAGARRLLNGEAGTVITVDLPELAQDLDTPEDYAAALGGGPTGQPGS